MAAGRVPGNPLPTSARADMAQFSQRSSLPGPLGLYSTEPIAASSHGEALNNPAASPRYEERLRSPPAALHTPTRTPEGKARFLTSSEIAMASSLFGTAVDYSKVRVHNGEFIFFQPVDVAMTPNGEMYFNPKRFKEDFSLSSFVDAHWFMHEMVHVWQYQLGYPVMARGAFRIGLGYEYTLAADKRLRDYNMEAQGNLLSDYWAVSEYAQPPSLWEPKYRDDLALYRLVLKSFIADPSDKTNLPK